MTNLERGLRVRRALLAIARVCLEQRCLFPRYSDLGAALGTDSSNVIRHMTILQDAGDVSLVNAGRRLYVRSVRP